MTFGAPRPAPNAAGWINSVVSVPFTAADATSGVAGTAPPTPLVLTGEGAAVRGTVTVTDVAGNRKNFSSPAVKIDRTAPRVTVSQSPKPNGSGWTNTAVTVTFTASDSLSGLSGSKTQSVILSQEGASQSPCATFLDVAGNSMTC